MNPGGNGGGYGPPGGGYGPPAGGGGGYGPPGGSGNSPFGGAAGRGPGDGGGYGAPPPGGYGAPPPGGPGAYSAPGWSAPGGFAPMPANFPPGYVPEGDTAPLQGGIPWEQKGGSLISKWWATMKACNSQPRPFFAAAAQNESGDAVLFAMVSGGVSGAFLGVLYVIIALMISAGLMMAMPHGARGGSPGAAVGSNAFVAGMTLGFSLFYAIAIIVSSAIGAAARPFLWGGLHHIILMMLGGTGKQKSFMHTVRAAAYAEGAAMPWLWIPIAGPFIATFYGIRNTVVGYDEAHRCGVGRALLAMFSPAICCCGCAGLMAALGAIPALMGP